MPQTFGRQYHPSKCEVVRNSKPRDTVCTCLLNIAAASAMNTRVGLAARLLVNTREHGVIPHLGAVT